MSETTEEKEVTCRSCGMTYVPSFRFDFYPDGDDPAVGLCERCLLTTASAHNSVKYTEPVFVEQRVLNTLCRPGNDAKTCRYIVMTSNFQCAKGTAVGSAIDARAESMRAKGDNCTGPPDFVPTP